MKLSHFLTLEARMGARLKLLWQKYAKAQLAELVQLIAQDKWDDAHRLVSSISVDDICAGAKENIDGVLPECVAFGAQLNKPWKQTALRAGAYEWPDTFMQNAQALLFNGLKNAVIEMQRAAAQLLEDAQHKAQMEAQGMVEGTLAVAKAAYDSALVEALNKAVLEGGSVAVDVGANLTTSRLVSYGYLAEADAGGDETYQITEILDERTCPFCMDMHGRTFSVPGAKSLLERALRTQDPNDLKQLFPFPKGDKESLKNYAKMTNDELQRHGYAVPPFHPLCRGVCVPVGTVDPKEMMPVPDVPPEIGAKWQPVPTQVIEAATEKLLPAAVVEAMGALMTQAEIKALAQLGNYTEINDWLRFCQGKKLITKADFQEDIAAFQKAEQPIVCQYYSPKVMNKIVTDADEGIKKETVVKETVMIRKAVGAAADDLLANWNNLEGALIKDKGFVFGGYKSAATTGASSVEVRIVVPVGMQVAKMGDLLVLPKDTVLQVIKVTKKADGTPYVRLKALLASEADADVLPGLPKKLPPEPAAGPPKTIETSTLQEVKAATLVEVDQAAMDAASLYLSDVGKTVANMSSTSTNALKEAWTKSMQSDAFKKMSPIQQAEKLKLEIAVQKKIIADFKRLRDTNKDVYMSLVNNSKIKAGMPIVERLALLQAAVKAKELAAAAAEQLAKLAKDKEALAAQGIGLSIKQLNKIGPKPGGSVPGAMYQDAVSADKWIVKYVASEDVARNEVLAGKLYEAAGIKVPQLELVSGPEGEIWVASKYIDDAKPDAAALKSSKRLKDLYEGYAIDAWLADWDVVGLDFDNILVQGNQAIRIDVGGSLNYRAQGTAKGSAFGDTVDEIDTLRNGMNKQAAVVFKDISEDEIRESVKRIAQIDDDTILQLVEKFGPRDQAENIALRAKLLARKANLIERYPAVVKTPKAAPLPEDTGDRVTVVESKIVKDSRSNGYVMPTDKDMIEDQSVLLNFVTSEAGTRKLVATLKVRGRGEEIMQAYVRKAANNLPDRKLSVFEASELNASIVSALKGLRAQAAAQQGPRPKDFERIAKVMELHAKFVADINDATLLETYDAYALLELAKHYRPWIQDLQEIAQTKTITFKKTAAQLFSSPAGVTEKFQPAAIAPGKGVQFSKTAQSNFFKSGVAKDGYVQEGKAIQWSTLNNAPSYAAEVDGVRITYLPTEQKGDFNALRALKNYVRVEIDNADTGDVPRVFEALKKIGLDMARPTGLDQEELYLRQILYQHRRAYLDTAKELTQIESQQERVDRLKEAIKTATNKKVDKLPGYNPAGNYQAFGQGRVIRETPLIDESSKEWQNFAKSTVLVHTVHNPDFAATIDRILDSGGALVATTDKLRRGISPKGLSPTDDMQTGGGDYVFTRIKNRDAVIGAKLVWKVRALKRTDAISYPSDRYGSVTSEEEVIRHRRFGIAEWNTIKSISGNETIFKNGLSLFDDFEAILVDTELQRDQVLAVLRRHKITKWPDGRRIEDMVIVKHLPAVAE
jgi:hypothetical protein